MENRPRFSRTQKITLSAALFALAASLIGLGAYASFTATDSESQSVTAGTMTLDLGGAGGTNDLTIAATGVAPGDTIQRAVDVRNTGNIDFSGITLTTAAAPSNLLSTPAAGGLQLKIEKCSTPWTPSGNTYSCGGSTSTVLDDGSGGSVPVVGAGRTLSNLGLTASSVNHLRVMLTLPTAADNTFQGLSTTITYTFDAAQRAATNR